MCRKQKYCSEFGDRQTWSRNAPLPPPPWLVEAVSDFAEAARFAACGEVETASLGLTSKVEGNAREWFVEHAQISANHRRRVLGVPRPGKTIKRSRSTVSMQVKRRVWERDNYTCRYCQLPTIPDNVRVALCGVVGNNVVPWGDTNSSRHGVALVARTEYDHVHPATLGGTDDESNLVTSCAACNYGKDRYTIDELGLDDPRKRATSTTEWDGLNSLVPSLLALSVELLRLDTPS